jgi:hypothetical protein
VLPSIGLLFDRGQKSAKIKFEQKVAKVTKGLGLGFLIVLWHVPGWARYLRLACSLTADRSQQDKFEQKVAKITKGLGLGVLNRPSTSSPSGVLPSIGLLFDRGQKSAKIKFEQKVAKITKGFGLGFLIVLRQVLLWACYLRLALFDRGQKSAKIKFEQKVAKVTKGFALGFLIVLRQVPLLGVLPSTGLLFDRGQKSEKIKFEQKVAKVTKGFALALPESSFDKFTFWRVTFDWLGL